MNGTKAKFSESIEPGNRIAVDIDSLAMLLSCGKSTARKIGKEAEAEIRLNSRVFYNVEKVRNYVNSMSGAY